MNNRKHFFKTDLAGWAGSVVLLVTLTGCIGYVDRPPAEPVYQSPPPMQTAIVVQDDYVYYPGYETYYSYNRHQYIYMEGGTWVSRPAPRGVSVNVLFASPSVRMDFHNSPATHHAVMVRQYPKNWRPPASHPDHGENHPGNGHDERGDNHEK